MAVSNKHFQKEHHKNGPANAFRHALWNYLIAKECTKWSKKRDAVIRWTKKITDWHEYAFPNPQLARTMDLHNNSVGRHIFRAFQTESTEMVIKKLLLMTRKSAKINGNAYISQNQDQLVHID